MTTNVKTPCKDCPFMATTKPGALGGSTPETYMGQVHGPFVLPCHKHCDFDDPNWREKALETPQCAGAAMFRKSMGISERLPAVLHSLDPVGPVLDTPVKFYAHHKKISPFMAMQHLKGRPPEKLLAEQIARQSNINFTKEKK